MATALTKTQKAAVAKAKRDIAKAKKSTASAARALKKKPARKSAKRKTKRKQTAKQKAASKRNLAKARRKRLPMAARSKGGLLAGLRSAFASLGRTKTAKKIAKKTAKKKSAKPKRPAARAATGTARKVYVSSYSDDGVFVREGTKRTLISDPGGVEVTGRDGGKMRVVLTFDYGWKARITGRTSPATKTETKNHGEGDLTVTLTLAPGATVRRIEEE